MSARSDPEQTTHSLARQVGGDVVVTLGPSGALVANDGALTCVPAYPVARVVDTTGAGDAFVGALAAGLSNGLDLIAATRWGAAAGCIAVAAAGAQGGRATSADIKALVGRIG